MASHNAPSLAGRVPVATLLGALACRQAARLGLTITRERAARQRRRIRRLVPGPAPGHVKYGARVEPAGVRTQPRDQLRDFAGIAEPFHRAVRNHRVDGSGAEGADHVGINRARGDTVYEDVLTGHLATQCL